MTEKAFLVRVDDELHKAVRLKAVEVDRPVSEIIRQLMRAWLRGELPTPPAEKDEEIKPF